MLCGNRFIRIIWLTLGVYLLVLNIIIWANNSETMGLLEHTTNITRFADNYVTWKTSTPEFKGFHWFYEYLSTFPGPLYTIASVNKYGNIFSNFNVFDNLPLDILAAIFRTLTWPVVAIWSVCVDIINNIIWFIGAFIKDVQ